MGKVSAEDYGEIRTRYRERAVRVLRQLDQGESYRAQIEADLAARRVARGLPSKPAKAPARLPTRPQPARKSRASRKPPLLPMPPAKATEPDSKRRGCGEKATTTAAPGCSACGTANDADARFCRAVAQKLLAASPSPPAA